MESNENTIENNENLIEKNENVIEKTKRKKRNFKDSLKNVSKFTNACRWVFMVVSVVEMVFACLLWVVLFFTVDVKSVGYIALNMVSASHYLIPLATLTQIVMLIVLAVDAIETKTEIKLRIIFVFMSIAPVLMTWSLISVYWRGVFFKIFP